MTPGWDYESAPCCGQPSPGGDCQCGIEADLAADLAAGLDCYGGEVTP